MFAHELLANEDTESKNTMLSTDFKFHRESRKSFLLHWLANISITEPKLKTLLQRRDILHEMSLIAKCMRCTASGLNFSGLAFTRRTK